MVKIVKQQIQQLNRIRQKKYDQALNLLGSPPSIAIPPTSSITKPINVQPLQNKQQFYNKWKDNDIFDLQIEFNNGLCEKTITFTYKSSNWKLPSISLFERKEDCRLPPDTLDEYEIPSSPSPQCFDQDCYYIWLNVSKLAYEDGLVINNKDAIHWFLSESKASLDEVEFPDNEYTEVFGFGQKPQKIFAKIYLTLTYEIKANYNVANEYALPEDEIIDDGNGFIGTEKRVVVVEERYRKRTGFGFPFERYGSGFGTTDYNYFVENAPVTKQEIQHTVNYVYPEEFRQVVFNIGSEISGSTTTPFRSGNCYPVSSFFDALDFRVVQFQSNIKKPLHVNGEVWTALTIHKNGRIDVNENNPVDKNPPPPPKPPMRCCPDNSALLREILKTVKENKKAIGVDDLPANLPESFLREDGIDSGQVEKPNLIQILGWYFERFDEILGQFEIDVEIEDADPTEEGNQSKTIKLPNVAEALAEITMLLLSITYNSDLNINLTTRALLESGQSKISSYKTHELLDTVVDYLGYDVKYENEKIPLSYTPGTDDLKELIKEKEVNAIVAKLNDNRTLPTVFQELLHSAAIIRALHWEKLDPNKDFKKQITDIIVSEKQYKDKISEDG
jgi:hypothetical protein